MNKKGFTLVELMVVMTILVILSIVSIQSFTRLMQEGDFETSIDRIYNNITSLSIETVISRARVSRASFYTSFSGGFFVYKENALDPYKMELAFLSGSSTAWGGVSIDIIVKNNTSSSGTSLNLVAHHKTKEDIKTSITLNAFSQVILSNTGFLTFSSLATLSEYRFAIVDDTLAVRSGELYFVPNANNITDTSILLARLEGTDFHGGTNSYDSIDISFDLKGRRKMIGTLNESEKTLKLVKYILLHTGLQKNMYFEVR